MTTIARYTAQNGHVYDSEQDEWIGPFETQADIDTWIADASNESTGVTDEISEARAPSNLVAFSLPVNTTPDMLLPFDPTRAKVAVRYKDYQPSTQSVVSRATVVTPGAFTTLTTAIAPVTGLYNVTAGVAMGATGDTTANNVEVFAGAAVLAVIPGTYVANSSQSVTFQIELTAGQQLALLNVAAGAAGSIYNADLTMESAATDDTSYVMVGRKEQINGSVPNGFRLYSGNSQDIDAQSEIWYIGVGASSNATISVMATTLLP